VGVKRAEGLADIAEAIRWVEQHWSEQPAPPVRLHVQGTEPESQLGAPRMAAVFWRYLTVSGDAVESVSVKQECSHPGVPQDREGHVLGIFCSCIEPKSEPPTPGLDCDRVHCPHCLGSGIIEKTAQRFTWPMRSALDRLAHDPDPKWYAAIVALARAGWDVRKAGVTDGVALTAIRKLHHRFDSGPMTVAWTQKSESQQRAETAA
jgi:hypothetical protein